MLVVAVHDTWFTSYTSVKTHVIHMNLVTRLGSGLMSDFWPVFEFLSASGIMLGTAPPRCTVLVLTTAVLVPPQAVVSTDSSQGQGPWQIHV